MLLQVGAARSCEGEHRPRLKSRDLGDSLLEDLWQAGKGSQAGRASSPARTNAEEEINHCSLTLLLLQHFPGSL